MMNTTRLILDTTNDYFYPISNNCIKFKRPQQCHRFLAYFGLPNSPIVGIDAAEEEILTLASESEIETDSNTDDRTSNEKLIYKTFFSQIGHRFAIFTTLPFEDLQSELFLETCEDYLSLVDKFNSPVFAPLKADVNGNINKLRRKINENRLRFQTLYAIVNDEIETRTTNAQNSATDALLWLKRAFEFLASFLREFGMAEKTLVDALKKAYEQSLKRHHGLLARSVFSFALRAVPDNKEFLRSFAIDPNDESQTLFGHQVFNEMLDHATDMSSVLQKITSFYSKHGLESNITVT